MKKKNLKHRLIRVKKINGTISMVSISDKQIEKLSRQELLGLTRALINVREGRQLEFSVPYASPQVIECAKQVSKMPVAKRDKEIARINAIALKA